MSIDQIPMQDRMNIGKHHREQFKSLYEDVGLIEDSNRLSQFLFIRGIDLINQKSMPSYEACYSILHTYHSVKGDIYFISHRWLSKQHPDPDGEHFNEIINHIKPDNYYWIDFTCLPQGDRSKSDESLFQKSIELIPSLLFDSHLLIVRTDHDDYLSRFWCVFESLSGYSICKSITYITPPECRHEYIGGVSDICKEILTSGHMPQINVTNPSDFDKLRRMTAAIWTFSKLNIVYKYLYFGQKLSNDELFFGEDPYFFMEMCDFSLVLSWAINELERLGLNWAALASDDRENLFDVMANTCLYRHEVDILTLPRTITGDGKRMKWFMENKDEYSSRINLFYVLTSKIFRSGGYNNTINRLIGDNINKNGVISIDDNVDYLSSMIEYQVFGHKKRLSIEIDCPPGDPRPSDVFNILLDGTPLTPSDFITSGKPIFGYVEYLVKPDTISIKKYILHRHIIKYRLMEYHNNGVVRAASW